MSAMPLAKITDVSVKYVASSSCSVFGHHPRNTILAPGSTFSQYIGRRTETTIIQKRKLWHYFLCMQSKYSKLWACQKDSSKLCWGTPTRRKTFFKALFIQETMSMMAPRKVGDGHAESDRLELGGDFHFFYILQVCSGHPITPKNVPWLHEE